MELAPRISDLGKLEVKQRSATLGIDPKNQELRHFIGSHRHEARLREAAGLNEKLSDRDFCAKVVLEVTGKEDKLERFDPMENCRARLEWRGEMDRSVRALLQDQDLLLDDRLQDASKHALRCRHLDKTYDWFQRHGKKEANKEKAAPAYLRFDATSAPMPGSMRKDPTGGAPGCWMPQPKVSRDAKQVLRQTGKVALMAAAAQSLGQGQAQQNNPSSTEAGEAHKQLFDANASRDATGNLSLWKPRF